MDLSNFYLNTPLDRPEYTRIKLTNIPQEIIDEYNLNQYAHNGWIYFKLSKGMYGLKQAGKLANDLLSKRLNARGYIQCDITPGLWRHKTHPVIFSLVVDDFGVKYEGQEHAQHLVNTLKKYYKLYTIDEAWRAGKAVKSESKGGGGRCSNAFRKEYNFLYPSLLCNSCCWQGSCLILTGDDSYQNNCENTHRW